MTCPSCGRSVPSGSRICGACGTVLDTASAAVPVAGHPAVAGWGATPPPARRRVGPGILAAAIALLLVFAAIGVVAARTVGARAGARSPEAAATGLLAALDKQDLDRAGGYLQGSERQLAGVYAERLTRVLANARNGGATGGSLAAFDLTARDLRFRRAATSGNGGVVVLEAVEGTVGVRGPNGVRIQVPVAEARRQLANQTNGAVDSLRLVTVRGSDDRWYVWLFASSAEWGRLASQAGEADYGLLADDSRLPGASSPEQAVRGLLDAATDGDVAKAADRLVNEEARVAAAYHQPLFNRTPLGKPGALFGGHSGARVRVQGLTTRTEQLADGVVKVHLTGGTVVPSGVPGARPEPIGKAMDGKDPAMVVVRQDGTWYPSLLGTLAELAVVQADRAG
jgi:hypothetical protein